MKKFHFQVAALLLATSSVTLSMMLTTKKLYNVSLSKCNRGLLVSCTPPDIRIDSNQSSSNDALILKSLKIIEKKLEEQNRLLWDLQERVIKNESVNTQAYALQMAQIEARCKILAAPGLSSDSRRYLFNVVDNMRRQVE